MKIENIKEFKKDNHFCIQPLNNLISILKKEMGFYSNFYGDLIKFFSNNHHISLNLTENTFAFLEEKSDVPIENIENIIISNGSRFINEILSVFEKNFNDKNKNQCNLECLRCIDYLMDCILILKKHEKKLDFQNLLMGKSQNENEELYMRNLLLKRNKIL